MFPGPTAVQIQGHGEVLGRGADVQNLGRNQGIGLPLPNMKRLVKLRPWGGRKVGLSLGSEEVVEESWKMNIIFKK